MDDRLGQEQCVAFRTSLRRLGEVLQTSRSGGEGSAIAVEVAKITRGFKILGRAYADQLVKKAQEVKCLQKEKRVLENSVEQLLSMSGKSREMKDACMVDRTTMAKPEEQMKNEGMVKDGHLHLHLKCQEELVKKELELAKIREAYTAQTCDLRESRRKKLTLEFRLKNAENEAASMEKERLECLKTYEDEITKLKDEIVVWKEETMQMRKKAGRLEEQMERATLKNLQFVELLKKDSKYQDELKRQQKTLKSYLQLLASKFTSTEESDDLQFQLRALECRGLDYDTTSYLKIILENGFRHAKCSVGTQTISQDISQSSSSTRTRYSTATEGTQKRGGNPSLHPILHPLTEDIDVLDGPWNLNIGSCVGEVETPQHLNGKDHEAIRCSSSAEEPWLEAGTCPDSPEEPWHQHVPGKSFDHVGSKRPIEVIDLDSDTDNENEKQHRSCGQGSLGLDRVGKGFDINIPLCDPSSMEIQRRRGADKKERRK